MKKFLLAAVVLLGSVSLANAEKFSMGVTVKGGVFEADGASEIFSGDHSSNTTSTEVTKSTADEGENAEAAVLMGSIFFEAALNDKISLGVNYVPHSMILKLQKTSKTFKIHLQLMQKQETQLKYHLMI